MSEGLRRFVPWYAIIAAKLALSQPGGFTVHTIDLKDHLGGSLNHLRAPDSLWESEWWSNAGFYTNRMLLQDWISAFEAAGFVVSIGDVYRWPHLPVRRSALLPRLRGLPDSALLTKSFTLVGS